MNAFVTRTVPKKFVGMVNLEDCLIFGNTNKTLLMKAKTVQINKAETI